METSENLLLKTYHYIIP